MIGHTNQPPSDEELDWLEDFLSARVNVFDPETVGDPGIIGISQLDGFLAAVVSGPETISPSVWMRELWGDHTPEFESEEDAAMFFGTIFRLMNDTAGSLMEYPEEYEPMFAQFESEPDEDFVDFWCSGYMRGVSLWKELDVAGKDLDHLLIPIMVNSAYSPEEVSELVTEEDRKIMKKAIPVCARNIHKYWLDRRAEFMPGGTIRKEQKAGVNDPCPCGSGLKYKKCCGAAG